MDILTLKYTPLDTATVLAEDPNAYEYPVKHYVTTKNADSILLTGYRNGRLVYAVHTTKRTYKRESQKIEKYVREAIENNTFYNSPLKEDCFADQRVVLYSSNNFSLLIEHDLYLTKNRIGFVERNIQWRNIEELINQYEISLDENDATYIRYYRDELEMLQNFDFMWLSTNTYILKLLRRYLECLQKDKGAT